MSLGIRSAVIFAVLSTTALADDLAPEKALQAQLAVVQRELAEKQQLVERVNPTRDAVDRASQKLLPNDRNIADIERALREVAPKSITFSATTSGAHVVLEGKSGAEGLTQMDSELHTRFPMAIVRTIELRGPAWRIELDFDPPGELPPAARTAAPVRAARPPQASARAQQLSELIQQAQSQLDMLEPLALEVRRLEAQVAATELRIRQQNEPNRARQAIDAVLPIFFWKGLLVSDGTVAFEVRRMSLVVRKGRPIPELGRSLAPRLKVTSIQGKPPTLELEPVMPP